MIITKGHPNRFLIVFLLTCAQLLLTCVKQTDIKNAYRKQLFPWNNPRKKSRSLIFIFTFVHLTFFTPGHKYGPIWARMDPYGPVYNFILLLYDLYIVFTLFLYDFGWFYIWLLTFVDIFWKFILHIFYHILRKLQGSFL